MIKNLIVTQFVRERKKRLRFLFKVLLFVIAIVALDYFRAEIIRYGIPDHIIGAVRFYLFADLLISFVRLMIVFIYERKHQINRGSKNNFILGINQIANILHTFNLIGSGLGLFGLSPINLITSLSIVAAAIAIISKDYIANMINGMLIMFSDELMIGDEIKIGEVKGKIVDITLINLHIINDDEDLIFIPNSMIFTSQIFNYTKRRVRKVSFDFDMKNELTADVAAIENYIKDALNDYEKYIKPESYNLRIIKINENYTALKFQFVLNKQANVLEKDIRRVALRAVLKYIGQEER